MQGANPIHVWKEKMVYSDKSRLTIMEAQEKCSKMGGHLPSIHSADEVKEILDMSFATSVWLGAKTLSKNDAQVSFQWSDGSKFDFEQFDPELKECSFTCCGIGLDLRAEKYYVMHSFGDLQFLASNNHMMIMDCNELHEWHCLLPFLTGQAAISWIQNQGLLSNLTSNDTSVKDFEQQLAIDLLNETLTSLQEMTGPILHKLEAHFASESKREQLIQQRMDKLNETLITLLEKAHSHEEEHIASEHPVSSESNESTPSSLVEGQNKSKTLPDPHGQNGLHLESGLNVYLGISIFVFVFVIVLLGLVIKGNLLSRCRERLPGPPRTYSRFGEARGADLLPVSLSSGREGPWRSESLHSSQDEVVMLNNPNLSASLSSNNQN